MDPSAAAATLWWWIGIPIAAIYAWRRGNRGLRLCNLAIWWPAVCGLAAFIPDVWDRPKDSAA